MEEQLIQRLLYNDESDKVENYIRSINDEKTLYIFSYNYNWDNGFEIPNAILQNSSCSLSIALLLFYNAGGVEYLEEKNLNANLPTWSVFIQKLYIDIIEKKYEIGSVAYENPLTKVQSFKLSKSLSPNEKVFLCNIEGENCNISL